MPQLSHLKRTAIECAKYVSSIYIAEPPINPRELCEDYLGIEYYHDYLGVGVRGAWFRLPDGTPHVVISEYESNTRMQFTSLHETAHEMLARKIKFTDHIFLDTALTVRTPLEKACDQFAALVLMPEKWIREWWDDLRFNPQYRILTLAARCRVSQEAMTIRVRSLGLR